MVNAFNGNLHYHRIDLTTSADRFPAPIIQSELSYSSLCSGEDRGFGFGWRFGYDMAYREEDDGDVTILWPDGREDRFDNQGDGEFTAPPGVHDTLTRPSTDVYRLTGLEGTVYYFDSARHRHITRLEAENGLALVFTYDANNRLTTLQDVYGRTLRLTYDGNGRVIRITHDFLNRSLDLAYDDDDNLAAITDPAGQITNYGYSSHRLSRVTLPDGRKYTCSYTDNDQVTAIRGSYGSWDFSSHGSWISWFYRTVDGQVRRTVYEFDDKGRVTQIEDPLGSLTRFEWDSQDNLIAATDAEGQRMTYTYNEYGNIHTQTDPLGYTSIFTRAAMSTHLVGSQDELGQVCTYSFDDHGNLVSTRDPLGHERTFTYEATGRLLSETDPLGYITSYERDAYGRQTHVHNSLGNTGVLAYDPSGGISTFRDPFGNTVTTTYNLLGWPVSMVDDLGHQMTKEYDVEGRLTRQTDPLGRVQQYQYDEAGYPSSYIDPRGVVERYQYDEAGNLLRATDGNGHTLRFEYDSLDNMIRSTDPNDQSTSFTYDRLGRPTGLTAPDGATVRYENDALGHLVRIDYPGDNDVTYAYDARSQLTEARNNDAVIRYAHDAVGNLLRQVVAIATQTYTTTYSYDAGGHRLTMTDPDGGVTRYGYDGLSRLVVITGTRGLATRFEYDAAGRMTRKSLPNGNYVTYTYDAVHNLLSLTEYDEDDQVMGGESYGYDAAGWRTRRTDLLTGQVLTYAYDAAGQLVGYQEDGSETTYTYDRAGNRLSQTSDSQTIAYTYDAANQLLRTEQSSPAQFTYDARGNLAARTTATGDSTYTYDAWNRLTEAQLADGSTVTYQYGPDGQLLARTDAAGTVSYIYDGVNLLMEKAPDGTTLAQYTMTPATDDLISLERGGTAYYAHRDALGSLTALSDDTGAIVERYAYDPFGVPLTPIPVRQPAFTGRPYDPAVGLYDMRNRTYAPALGRFLQRDPLGAVSGLNFYIYVCNNPTNETDLLGFGDNDGYWWNVVSAAWDTAIGAGEVGLGIAGIVAPEPATTVGGVFLFTKGCGDAWLGAANLMNAILGKKSNIPSNTFDALAQGSAYALGLSPKNKELLRIAFAMADMLATGKMDPFKSVSFFAKGGKLASNMARTAKGLASVLGKFGDIKWSIDKAVEAKGYWYVPGVGPNGKEVILKIKPPKRLKDHSDDTLSVASPQFPAAGATGLTTNLHSPSSILQSPLYRRTPRIAILWNGFPEEAGAFLNSLGEPYDTLDVDFSPVVAALYPVLLIPSGGLYGLEGSASFRARLEAYVAGGGTILVSAQQKGYEFAALPGGLSGYGWAEDQSCFNASVYFPQYHQALSGFNGQYLTTLVDGYFTTYPTNTVSLLDRDKNGYPAALLYPYGDGYVMATTIYADWGHSNYQCTRHDHRVWRDLIAWGTLAGATTEGATTEGRPYYPDFSPGEPVTVSVRLQNASGQDATAARLIFLDPDKNIFEEQTITVTVSAGDQVTITHTPLHPTSLGVWAVDYVLLDDDGYVIQDQAIGAAFVVSDPAASIGPARPWDFWTTAPSEYWAQGMTGEFTFHIRNRTASARDNVQVRYVFYHHAMETGDPTYGRPDLLIHDVGAVPANSEITFTVQATMLTKDRIFGYLYEDGRQKLRNSFQIRSWPAAAQATVQPAQDSYYVGQPVTVTVTLTNTEQAPYAATARLQATAPGGATFDLQEQPFTLDAEGSVAALVYTLTMPVTPTFGLHTLQVEALRDGQVVGFGQAHFDLPSPHVAVTVQGPDAYRLGQDNTVAFILENQGGTIVDDGAFNVRLEAPGGQTLWNASDAFTLDGWQAVTFTHSVPFSTALGVYRFVYETRMHGGSPATPRRRPPPTPSPVRRTSPATPVGRRWPSPSRCRTSATFTRRWMCPWKCPPPLSARPRPRRLT
jgi:RHS repeat-associated protein